MADPKNHLRGPGGRYAPVFSRNEIESRLARGESGRRIARSMGCTEARVSQVKASMKLAAGSEE